jgi:hypothetical protein
MIASNLQYHHALLLVKGLHLCQIIERHSKQTVKDRIMHEIDWKWCPRVAAHEITRDFLISQARLQKAQKTLEAYGQDLDDLLEVFADLPFDEFIEAKHNFGC